MIKLYQFRPFWGLPNASPFCMKAETYLRFRSLSYQPVACNPRQSPSKQIPFIESEEKGHPVTITDSQQIIDFFEAQQQKPLDADLTAQQKAMAWFIRGKVEDELYWQITYMRWGDPQGWRVFLPDLNKHMQGLKGKILPTVIRRMLLRQMARRGMTPKNPTASYAPGIELLNALADMLGNQLYFLGNEIHTLDMSLYAFLANIIDQPHANALQNHAKGLENLVAYCERIKALIWDGWEYTGAEYATGQS